MRRMALAWLLLASVALAWGCGPSRYRYAAVNPAEVDREDVLVVGRVRVFYDGEEVTDRAVLHTSPGHTYRLGPDGHVSWLVRRPMDPMHFDALDIEGDESGLLELGQHRLLFVPHDVDVRMFYAGDVAVVLGEPPKRDFGIELHKRNPLLRIGRGDRADRVLRRIATNNEHIAGAQYYNVVREARAKAPELRGEM